MKQIISILAVCATLILGCSKDKTPSLPGQGTLSAKIDGSAWSASLAVQAVVTSGILQVTGSDNAAKQMSVNIMNYTGPGTYVLGGAATSGNGSNGRWTEGLNSTQTYSTMVGQGEGTCTITSDDKGKVEGTFSFNAKNTDGKQVVVTDGKFKASY